MGVYINGVLYGERHMNTYDHLVGVSNQWGNMIDVYEPDLYVGKAPKNQHSTANTGRYTNILEDANEKGHDFVGEFTMVAVWNNYLMTEAEAAKMAGMQDASVPAMTVKTIPVHRPTEFAMTPREATGITNTEQPRLTIADYAVPPPSTPKNVIPNSGKDDRQASSTTRDVSSPSAAPTPSGVPGPTATTTAGLESETSGFRRNSVRYIMLAVFSYAAFDSVGVVHT